MLKSCSQLLNTNTIFFPDTICVPQQTAQCKIYSRCTINTEISQVEEYQGGIKEKDETENQDYKRLNKKLRQVIGIDVIISKRELLSHEKKRTEEKDRRSRQRFGDLTATRTEELNISFSISHILLPRVSSCGPWEIVTFCLAKEEETQI